MASLFERLDKESPSELTKRSEESLDWFRQNLRDLRIIKEVRCYWELLVLEKHSL